MNFGVRAEKIQRFVRKDVNCAYLVTGKENVYYLSGFYGTFGVLLITRNKTCLFVDGRYYEQAKKTADCRELRLTENIYASLKEFALAEGVSKFIFDPEATSFAFYSDLKKQLDFVKILPASENKVKKMRMIKEEDEIKIMMAGARKSRRIFSSFIKENELKGATEREIALNLEYKLKQGGDGISFDPIVLSGRNSSFPHGVPSGRRIRVNEPVIIDFGLMWNHYATDHTRTFYVNGSILEKYYRIVQEAVKKGIQKIRHGCPVSEADIAVRTYFDGHGLLKNFLHSTGHGIGLSVHEPPSITHKTQGVFEAGMITTIEPGLYFEGVGGIRIEEMLLVTQNGCEVL